MSRSTFKRPGSGDLNKCYCLTCLETPAFLHRHIQQYLQRICFIGFQYASQRWITLLLLMSLKEIGNRRDSLQPLTWSIWRSTLKVKPWEGGRLRLKPGSLGAYICPVTIGFMQGNISMVSFYFLVLSCQPSFCFPHAPGLSCLRSSHISSFLGRLILPYFTFLSKSAYLLFHQESLSD